MFYAEYVDIVAIIDVDIALLGPYYAYALLSLIVVS